MAKIVRRKQRADEQWEDVRARVNETIRRFIRDTKWQVDWEEAWAEAALVFAECRKKLDLMKASLPTFVCYTVYKRLLSMRRKAARRHGIVEVKNESDMYDPEAGDNHVEFSTMPDPDSETGREFDLIDFIDRLPGDAAAVVWLAVCPPTRLRRQTKAALVSYLTQAGWDRRRIARAFKLVRRRLR